MCCRNSPSVCNKVFVSEVDGHLEFKRWNHYLFGDGGNEDLWGESNLLQGSTMKLSEICRKRNPRGWFHRQPWDEGIM